MDNKRNEENSNTHESSFNMDNFIKRLDEKIKELEENNTSKKEN